MSKDHLVKSSAMVFSAPGMWLASNSTPVVEAKRVRISTKRQSGFEVVNNLLLALSAPVLSRNDFKQIGTLKPGNEVATSQTKAICASVSKAEILRCKMC